MAAHQLDFPFAVPSAAVCESLLENEGRRVLFLSAVMLSHYSHMPTCLHAVICCVLFGAAALKTTDRNPVLFVTIAATMIPFGTEEGKLNELCVALMCTYVYFWLTPVTHARPLWHVVWHTYCTCSHVCQGDMQRQSDLFTRFIIECSKFLNSRTVIKTPHSAGPSSSRFELEQHPEGNSLELRPVGTLVLPPEGSGSEGWSSRNINYFSSSTLGLI